MSGEGLGLGNLALVMGEDEVAAPAVQIDRGSEEARAHHGALDVPARAARTPRAVPGGLARRLSLPEHEVERIALARIVGPVAALVGHGQHLRALQVAEPAEARPGVDAVVDAAARRVRETALDEHAHRGDDVGDDVGRARVVVRRADIEHLHVADEVRRPAVAQRAPVLPQLGRLAQHVVVDVGDVLDIAHRQPLALQVTHEHVGGRVGEGVAQVRGVVGRDAAHIEADGATNGLEGLDGAGQGVVEPHLFQVSSFRGRPARSEAPRGRPPLDWCGTHSRPGGLYSVRERRAPLNAGASSVPSQKCAGKAPGGAGALPAGHAAPHERGRHSAGPRDPWCMASMIARSNGPTGRAPAPPGAVSP